MGLFCNTGKENSFFCFPLSVACIIFAGLIGTLGGINVYSAVTTKPMDRNFLILSSIDVGYALFIFVAVICRFSFLMILCFGLAVVEFIWKVITFVLLWIDWGTKLRDGRMKFHWQMVTTTVFLLFFILFLLSIANVMLSAAYVYKAGGTGWEFKTYEQIEKKKKNELAQDEVENVKV